MPLDKEFVVTSIFSVVIYGFYYYLTEYGFDSDENQEYEYDDNDSHFQKLLDDEEKDRYIEYLCNHGIMEGTEKENQREAKIKELTDWLLTDDEAWNNVFAPSTITPIRQPIVPMVHISVMAGANLPSSFTQARLNGLVIPLLQDVGIGSDEEIEVDYVGHGVFGITQYFTFRGWCPIHKRRHDSAKFQLQKNMKDGSCWWKCFRDGRNVPIPFGADNF